VGQTLFPAVSGRAPVYINATEETTMNLIPRDTFLDMDKVFDSFFSPKMRLREL